jgi:alpha-beta hydrolase superfamily lysophospholipase
MNNQQGNFYGADNLELYYRVWEPVNVEPKALLVILHGAGEHVERYNHLVEALVPAGYILAGYDLRGHGRSKGQRGHINSWGEYRGDLERFITFTRQLFSSLPVFLYGHSLGSMIVLDYIIKKEEEISGAVLSGTPIEPKKVAPPHQVFMVKLFSRIIPKASLNMHVEGQDLSRDAGIAAAYDADPLVHWKRSFRWGAEALKTVQRIREGVSDVSIPVLFVHGECDRSVSLDGSKYCYKEVKSTDKQLRIYPGCLHEPHNDLDYKIVVADIQKWLDARTKNREKG